MLIRRQALDEAARSAVQRDDTSILDMHLVNAAQSLAIERLHLGVADLA